jgi:hypothetical protein
MTARSCKHSGTGSFAQANGSSFARASFNFILLVIGAVFAVSIFAFSAVLSLELVFVLLIGVLLAVIIALRGLICRPQMIRPGSSAA